MNESAEEKLGRIYALLALAFAPEIRRASEEIRESPVASAILDRCTEWSEVGRLKAAVAKEQSVSAKTVQRKIAELESLGVLLSQGAGTVRQVRNSGVI